MHWLVVGKRTNGPAEVRNESAESVGVLALSGDASSGLEKNFLKLVAKVLAEKADLPSVEVLRRAREGGYTGARERFTV